MAARRPHPLIVAVVTAAALGSGAIILQRWVAQTFQSAVALVVIWFVIVAVFAYLYQRSRPGLRAATFGTLAVLAIAGAGVGYWTAFRKDEVNEQVMVASARAGAEEREVALMGATTQAEPGTPPGERHGGQPEPRGPVELASGRLSGADGHAGEGTATIVRSVKGDRVLTLTGFDVDAGPDVNVYLSETTDGVDESIDLGDLKGERGNQQYEIPADADLTRFGDLVLWCIPFTTRIATAELR